jgi:hypothetical protein
MKRQSVHALFPLDRIDPHHRRLAGELDCRHDRIELGHIEIAVELFTRFRGLFATTPVRIRRKANYLSAPSKLF